jgi:hypothetical protein
LAVRVERVFSITELQRFHTITVNQAHTSLLEFIERIVIVVNEVIDRIIDIIQCVSLYQTCKSYASSNSQQQG